MRTTRFNFEKAVQEVTTNNTQWLKDEFKEILESNKEFTRKADYIGFSISSIDNKIASLDEEIAQMNEMKNKLKVSKELALEVGAEVFLDYGIEKLEGAGISSITVSPSLESSTTKLLATDEAMLIRAGFSKVVVDMDLVQKKYNSDEYLDIIKLYTTSERLEKSRKAKLKVNKRRKAANNTDTSTIQIAAYQEVA